MFNIQHRIGIAASVNEIFISLTTDKGLAKWWTSDTYGAGDVGSIIKFRFAGNGPDFEVMELIENKLVRWQHRGEMPDAWSGTEITFQLVEDDTQTIVLFKHSNWQESTDFMAHCSMKWAVFMLSLKQAIETGKGRPYPDDVHIDLD